MFRRGPDAGEVRHCFQAEVLFQPAHDLQRAVLGRSAGSAGDRSEERSGREQALYHAKKGWPFPRILWREKFVRKKRLALFRNALANVHAMLLGGKARHDRAFGAPHGLMVRRMTMP